jgi:hypothetical protein
MQSQDFLCRQLLSEKPKASDALVDSSTQFCDHSRYRRQDIENPDHKQHPPQLGIA